MQPVVRKCLLPQLSKLKSSQNKGEKAIAFHTFGHKFAEFGDGFPAFPANLNNSEKPLDYSIHHYEIKTDFEKLIWEILCAS